MATASSERVVDANVAGDAFEITGAGEFEFQINGKSSFDPELLRMASVEPAVEDTLDKSTLKVASLAVTLLSK
jgi:hypothetical protein